MTLSVVHAMYTIASTQSSKIVFRETTARRCRSPGRVSEPCYRRFRVAPDDYSPLSHVSNSIVALQVNHRILIGWRLEYTRHAESWAPGEAEHDP